MKQPVKDLFILIKSNLLIQLLTSLKELLFILDISLKLYKLIMDMNLLILKKLKEYILLVYYVVNLILNINLLDHVLLDTTGKLKEVIEIIKIGFISI